MSSNYISSTLLRDETIVYIARPHWIIFLPSLMVLGFSIFLYYYTPSLDVFKFLVWKQWRMYQVLGFILLCAGVIWYLRSYIQYVTSEYGVTNKRILMKTGWIRRNALEIFLKKIESIDVDQTITGRVLNYGTLVIVGTGGTRDSYFYVPRPLWFRKCVQQQADLVKGEE